MERGANTFPFHNLLPYSESNEGLFLLLLPSLNWIKIKVGGDSCYPHIWIQKILKKSVHRITLTTAPAATVGAVAQTCDLCGLQSHLAPECPLLTGVPAKQANYVQGNPYSNTYNPGWKNHPN